MKVFDCGNKVNFIDENNICVGYDLSQDCCEHAGWFISPIASSPLEVCDLPDKHDTQEWTNYTFDISYKLDVEDEAYELYMVIFRLTKDDNEIFLHLFNVHNGYYTHGFELKKDDAILEEGRI